MWVEVQNYSTKDWSMPGNCAAVVIKENGFKKIEEIIIYSLSCHSKPVWFYLCSGTKKEINVLVAFKLQQFERTMKVF